MNLDQSLCIRGFRVVGGGGGGGGGGCGVGRGGVVVLAFFMGRSRDGSDGRVVLVLLLFFAGFFSFA